MLLAFLSLVNNIFNWVLTSLGFAKLSGLNIASNPLEMPPSSVIERGTQVRARQTVIKIISFLC